MKTLEQTRASQAFTDVKEIHKKPKEAQRKYATLAHKLPSLISNCGLCQALYYIESRGKEEGQFFLGHLAGQLHRVNSGISDASQLLERARDAKVAEYLWLTSEAMSVAAWYRRMVQSILKIEMAEADANLEDDGGAP